MTIGRLKIMQWSYDDPITGERLQALAAITVLTPSILAFHASLRTCGVREVALFPGTHTELAPLPSAIARLRGRRAIFVYSHLLRSFVEHILPQLDHRFVLVSHNSDAGVGEEFRPTLDDARIVHWFAQNCLITHPKLTPLPIGLANAQWPHGDLAALLAVANAPRVPARELIYVNFEVRTNPAVRAPLLERLRAQPLVWVAPSRPFAAYLADMRSCRWVVSPPGNGVDCHRTWEALYLGITPIVARTAAGAALHDDLPIVQLGDLAQPDPLALQRDAPPADERLSKLTMGYWRERLHRAMAAAA
jgi:hypothetical protein